MPKVKIQKKTPLAPTDAYTKVRDVLSKAHDLKKLDPSFSIRFDDVTLTGSANGKMFRAELSIKSSASGSEVEIHVDLPLTLALFKGTVEATLKKKLEESLS
jgi:hypothetical protein